MQIQANTNTYANRWTLLFRFYSLLTSVLRHKERDTILTILTPSPRMAHLVVFKISVGRDPKILIAARTVENSTLCPNGRNSIVCLHGPMSTFN